MEETEFRSQDFLELVKKIESENAAQTRYARKQYYMSCISAAASVLVLAVVIVCVVVFVPQLQQTMDQVDTVLTNLEAVTAELSALVPELSQSLPELVEDLDALVNSSGEEISQALQKVSALDIDSLNEAIRNLRSIVEPMARLFGK